MLPVVLVIPEGEGGPILDELAVRLREIVVLHRREEQHGVRVGLLLLQDREERCLNEVAEPQTETDG